LGSYVLEKNWDSLVWGGGANKPAGIRLGVSLPAPSFVSNVEGPARVWLAAHHIRKLVGGFVDQFLQFLLWNIYF